MAGLLSEIREQIPQLRRSERKVAEQVLEAPELVLRQSLASLARRAGVSEPTVIRFCRAVHCEGYSDFKLSLAQALAAGAPYIHRDVTVDDDLRTVVDKIINVSSNALATLRESLDLAALERATKALIAARRIDCYGVGAATIAAMDAHQKFMRLGVPSSVLLEGHAQTMSACTLQPGDAALAFSFTGQIRDIVRTATIARDRGAFVIAITRSGSVLSRIASLTIAVDTSEDTFIYAPMATRLAHMACIDVLATNVAIGRGGDMSALFQRIKDSLDDQHIVEAPRGHDGPGAEAGDAEQPAPRPFTGGRRSTSR